ncbi:MAG: Inositol 2-dehydrogenase/D-chiro-inositol 3-dehydrogenase [Methanomicrobiales archaeon 53_19]|uniref:hypothetical protein n=1 Tax=Methanocalculus sp. TaxID=2004547 RepID=UPI000748DBCF|nr:hypothetical protein [Methanocalculus sp.]KUK69653.1 MAG: Inositol 2-dehydrogenase/D-chiro-inositol 3-dehydrogenase [Methanocalculus sp. 52_23]KUL02858.1 MAG: Inositol 2-dehydrogenase/D-chiro-inositol 3-dehydrogenase [Methanomicrobiales archaeon 53_19]HIJ05929.1 hypothetical protein [Methanocalculus sp.]
MFHYAVTSEVLNEGGVAMLIEKPVCVTVEESQMLINAIPEDLTVGVGYIERFNPIIGEIQRIMDAPLYVEMKRHNPASGRITDASIVEDLMIHDIDIMRHVLFNGGYSLHCGGTKNVCFALFTYRTIPVLPLGEPEVLEEDPLHLYRTGGDDD